MVVCAQRLRFSFFAFEMVAALLTERNIMLSTCKVQQSLQFIHFPIS